MSYIAGLDPADAGAELHDVLERLPPLPHFRLLAHAQTAFLARLAYGQVIMGELELSHELRELIILRIARLTNCEYVAVQHRHAASKTALSQKSIAAFEQTLVDVSTLDEQQRAVLRFVDEMVQNFGASRTTTEAVNDLLGAQQLIEIGLVVERYLGLSILLNSLGAEPSEAFDLEPVRDFSS